MLHLFSRKKHNTCEMVYHAQEVDFAADGSFVDFTEETWIIGDKIIKTPHGTLSIKKVIFVENGPHVGLQFTVDGKLNLGDFSCSNGDEGVVQIKTFAVVRQPHNVWLWCYAFDKNNMPCVNFCGHDDLDGLRHFYSELKSK